MVELSGDADRIRPWQVSQLPSCVEAAKYKLQRPALRLSEK